MTLIVFALAVAAAPRVIGPHSGVQTNRGVLRVVVASDDASAPTIRVNNADAGRCERSPRMKSFAHCQVPLTAGANNIVFADAQGVTVMQALRYATLGRLPDGVALDGFGAVVLHEPKTEAQCVACHRMQEGAQQPATHPSATHPAATGSVAAGPECLSCHADVVTRTKRHGPVANLGCSLCHQQTGEHRQAVIFPIRDTCLRCHEEMRQLLNTAAFRHGPTAQGRCTTCHDPHGSDETYWLKRPVFDLCTNCHQEKAVERHVVAGFVFGDSHPMRGRPHPLKLGELGCSSCHNPHAAQSRFLWQFSATNREALCQTCHAK